MPRLDHTHTHTRHTKHDLHLLPLAPLSLYALPYRAELLYNTHTDDALILNAAHGDMQTYTVCIIHSDQALKISSN